MEEKFLKSDGKLLDDSILTVISVNPVMMNLGYCIQEIGDFFFQGHYTEREGLDSYQIAFIFGGEQTLQYRGREYPLGAGSAFFIDCRYHYRIDGMGNEHVVFVHFLCDKASFFVEQFFALNNNSPVLRLESPCFVDTGIMHLMKLFKEGTEVEASYQGYEIINSLMTQLMMTVLQKRDSGHYDEYVEKIICYLNENYYRKITLNELAQETHLSKFHMSRLFCQKTGASPIEYLMRIRINKAKELLRQTTYSVSQISEKVGLENTSYFIRFFRRFEVMSPGEFRKKWC